VDARLGQDRHLDDSDLERVAQLEELLELGETECAAELLAGHVGCAGRAAPDDVLQRDEAQQAIESHTGVVAQSRTKHGQRVVHVNALALADRNRATGIGSLRWWIHSGTPPSLLSPVSRPYRAVIGARLCVGLLTQVAHCARATSAEQLVPVIVRTDEDLVDSLLRGRE
jgi:hypothetical protein